MKPRDLLAKNLSFIARYCPLAAKVAQPHKRENLSVVITAGNKRPTLQYCRAGALQRLNSRQPREELDRMIGATVKPGRPFVLFGLGDGTILQVFRNYPFSRLIIIEPSLAVLRANLLLHDLAGLLGNEPERVTIIAAPDLDEFRDCFYTADFAGGDFGFAAFIAYRSLTPLHYRLATNFFPDLPGLFAQPGQRAKLLQLAEKFLDPPVGCRIALTAAEFDLTGKSVCLIQLSSIGDVLYTTPVIAGLRARWPGIRLALITEAPMAELMRRLPDLTVIPYRTTTRDSSLFWTAEMDAAAENNISAMLAAAADFAPDVVINLHTSYRSAFLTKWLGRPALGFHVTTGIDCAVAGSEAAHDRWRGILKRGPVRFALSKEEMLLRQAGITENFPVLLPHPPVRRENRIGIMAGSNSPARRWPAEHFAGLIDLLAARHDCRFLLFGASREIPLNRAIIQLVSCPEKVTDYAGKLRLDELPEHIAPCRHFIANDTGLAHLAGALGVPLTVIQGTNLRGGMVYHPNAILACHHNDEAACQSCHAASRCAHAEDRHCLRAITPEHAAALVRDHEAILRGRSTVPADLAADRIGVYFYPPEHFTGTVRVRTGPETGDTPGNRR